MEMGPLLSSLLIGSVGMGIFVYGKRVQDLRALGCGVTLMAFPYFVHSVILMWVIAVACVGGLWALVKGGGGV